MDSAEIETYIANEVPITCPECGSDVNYRYGHTAVGKQKYLCLICNRQFVAENGRSGIRNRPYCPKCGSVMHVYKQYSEFIRFRCSAYPHCREFVKLAKKE